MILPWWVFLLLALSVCIQLYNLRQDRLRVKRRHELQTKYEQMQKDGKM